MPTSIFLNDDDEYFSAFYTFELPHTLAVSERRGSSLKTGPARPGHAKIALYIPLQSSLINFLFTVPVQWPGMIDSASSDFTVCIKGPNIGSF